MRAPDTPANPSPSTSAPPSPSSHEGRAHGRGGVAQGEIRVLDLIDRPLSSPAPSSTSSTQHTAKSSFSLSSSVPTTFASLSESVSDIASITEPQKLHRRYSEATNAVMTTFSPFSLTHWITGEPSTLSPLVQSTSQEVRDELTSGFRRPVQSHRAEREGVQDKLGQSFSLPDSGNRLEHIAAACSDNFNPQLNSTGSVRASFQTGLANGSLQCQPDNTGHSCGNVESNSDLSRDEASPLPKSTAQDSAWKVSGPPPLEDGVASSHNLQSDTAISASQSQDSAAARLQKAHEQAQQRATSVSTEVQTVLAPPPSSLDFPELGDPSKSVKLIDARRDVRKPSYRDIASTGTQPMSTVKIVDALQTDGIDDDSILGSYKQQPGVLVTFNPSPTSKASSQSAIKQSPHFAQPTESFARRTDETLRKGATLISVKAKPEALPPKSTGSTSQRHPKRKSLPIDWMISTFQQTPQNNTTVAMESKKSSHPECKTPPGRVQQKKSSSYMSPTKATTRRNIATLGENTTKRISPKVQKPLIKIDTSASLPPEYHIPDSAVITSATTAQSCDSFTLITDVPSNERIRNVQVRDEANRIKDKSAEHHESANTRPQDETRRTSNRMPRRSTIASSVTDFLTVKAREIGLPAVANTTPQRRGSHGHILLPIANRLAKLGLLRANDATSMQLPSRTAEGSIEREYTEHASPLESTHYSSSDDHPILGPLAVEATSLSPSSSAQKGLPDVENAYQTPILNAAAKEFKPMPKAQNMDCQLRAGDLEALMTFRSPEEWKNMSLRERRIVTALRDRYFEERRHHVPDSASVQSMSSDAVKIADQQLQDVLTMTPPPVHNDSASSGPNMLNRESPAHEGGSLFTPEMHARKNAAQQILNFATGGLQCLKFGRAPPPPYSPLRTPTRNSIAGLGPSHKDSGSWVIAPASYEGGLYGWSGGDGREVKFTGFGPDAERDPKMPVNINFRGRRDSTGRGPRMVGPGEDENSPPLAPRSRRQWAERVGYPMVPCGEIDITHAIEFPVAMNPFAHQLAGYCFDHAARSG